MPAQIVARSETHKRVLRELEEQKNTEISAERQKELDAFDAKILALRQADTNHDGDIDRGEWSTAMKQEGGSSTSRSSSSSSSSSSYSDAEVRQTTKPVISTPIRTSYTSSYSYTPAPLRNSYASSSVTSYTPAPASSRTGGYDPWARYQSTLGTARKAPKPLGPRPAFTRDSPEGTSGGAAVVTSSYSTYSSAAPSAASSTSSSASSITSSNASSNYAPWNNYKTTLSPQKGPTERRSNVLRLSLGGSRRMFRSDTHKRVLEKLGLDENASPTKRNKIDAEAEVQSEFDAKILALRKADTNHDGDIDRSEWSTAVEAV